MGGARGPVRLRTEGPRVMGAPTCAKYSSECSVFARLIVNVILSLLGESVSLFIDEGDGLYK